MQITHKISILVVDDDPVVRFLHRKIIEFFNNLVVTYNEAINGDIAIQMLRDFHKRKEQIPNFILLDLNMPVMNGFEFIEAYSELNIDKSRTEILVVTSSENSKDQRRCNDLGVTKFISKPMSIKILEEEINLFVGVQKERV